MVCDGLTMSVLSYGNLLNRARRREGGSGRTALARLVMACHRCHRANRHPARILLPARSRKPCGFSHQESSTSLTSPSFLSDSRPLLRPDCPSCGCLSQYRSALCSNPQFLQVVSCAMSPRLFHSNEVARLTAPPESFTVPSSPVFRAFRGPTHRVPLHGHNPLRKVTLAGERLEIRNVLEIVQ